jgi:hypothetical protein
MTVDSRAQFHLPDSCPSLRGWIVYFETGGPGYRQSLNLEKVLFRINTRTLGAARVGYGFAMLHAPAAGKFYSIPVGLSLVKGFRNHKMEAGANLSIIQNVMTNFQANRGIYFFPTVGYRFQRATGGFFFKLHFSPAYKVYELVDTHRQEKGQWRLDGSLCLGWFFAKPD